VTVIFVQQKVLCLKYENKTALAFLHITEFTEPVYYSCLLTILEDQLSQRIRMMLHVLGNFAKSLKVTQGHSKLHQ